MFLSLFVGLISVLLLFSINPLIGSKHSLMLQSLQLHRLFMIFLVLGHIVIKVSGFLGSLRGALDVVVLVSMRRSLHSLR